ncbi:MAG TPA: HD domain-containing protein [Candidatus Bathyarchaeia archaeon]|nr:HD domain-containing protein [Candidatus Bathyarchaeia archaeon]
MQELYSTNHLKDRILEILHQSELDSPCYSKILDYTIDLFHQKGLGIDYYGYHNIIHELEVTYVTLIAAQWESLQGHITKDDIKYLFVAALFHDYDPQKRVDKPHEPDAVNFVKTDKTLELLLKDANIDSNIIAAMILRTTYPWTGEQKEKADLLIDNFYSLSDITRNDPTKVEYYKHLGWFLSVADRIGGYALGDFTYALEMAKKNAHSLAWHPNLIAIRAVTYFEDLLNNESEICNRILAALPRKMRKLFMDNVLGFMKLRETEIQNQAVIIYDKVNLVPTIEPMKTRQTEEFTNAVFSIFEELPHPLQFDRVRFAESIHDSQVIINTLRLGNENGPIVGYAKGSSLENYKIREGINDPHFGKGDTVFLEPIALKMGYWGLKGGREIRLLFLMQAQSKGYKYLSSFALRDVIEERMRRNEKIEFVKQFDPERWDYYRVRL